VLFGDFVTKDNFHIKVVARDLTSKLYALTSVLAEESILVTEKVFCELAAKSQDPDGWFELPVWKTLLPIIAQISNKIFVGLPLCRNQEYLSSCTSFASLVFPLALVLRSLPYYLRVYGTQVTCNS